MKKKALLLLVVSCSLIVVSSLFAQAPNQFKYQVVLRDHFGNLIAGQTVYFKISILKGGSTGTESYSEEQQTLTNQYGLANLNIGSGTNQNGSIGSIDWGGDTYFIKVEFKQTSGGIYQEMGTSQLLSVPYALSAGSLGIPGIIGQTLFHNGEMWKASSLIFNDGTNVGIGTRKPAYKLHINGDAKASSFQIGTSVGPIEENWWEFGIDNNKGTGIDFHTHTSGSTDYDARIYREPGDDGNFNIFNAGNGNLYLGANNSPTDLVVSANHNVGIGTTNPVANLQIKGGQTGNTVYNTLFIKNPAGADNVTYRFAGVGYNDNVQSYIDFNLNSLSNWKSELRFGTSNKEAMRINSDGNVGIGTTNPQYKLSVNGGIYSDGKLDVGDKITRNFTTGSANLVPIAYGHIANDGIILSGSGNFTCTVVSNILEYYFIIHINNYYYNDTDYTVIVQPSVNMAAVNGDIKMAHNDALPINFVIYKP